MRKYYFSIVLHIIVLLILVYPFLVTTHVSSEMEHVVIVDFSKLDEDRENDAVTKEVITPSKPKASDAKPKNTLKPSVKPIQKQPVEMPKRIVHAVAPAPVSTQNNVIKEVATQHDVESSKADDKALLAQATAQRKNFFKGLISRVKEDTSSENGGEGQSINGESESEEPKDGSFGDGSISGKLSSRKILFTPTIEDNSQKEGRVVVKICVDASGIVTSSQYTQKGSTTSDAYLIQIAEEGAAKYRFSSSTNDLECGRVTILFELK
jgi:outer membrane biosynthesis protein TonB